MVAILNNQTVSLGEAKLYTNAIYSTPLALFGVFKVFVLFLYERAYNAERQDISAGRS